MATPWLWSILAVILVAVEIMAPGVYFMWFGLAAGLVATVLWAGADLPWQGQGLLFAVFSIVTVVVGDRWVRRHPIKTDHPNLNRRAEQLIGQTYRLDDALINGAGKLAIGDSVWLVSGQDIPAGSIVRVVAVDGSVLRIEQTKPRDQPGH